jgi:hypothetical protein
VASITKYRCDHCGKEVEDIFLENGWIRFQGSVTRSWGRRKNGGTGDPLTDYIGGSPEFCSVTCLVGALNTLRAQKKGPIVMETPETPKEEPKEEAPESPRRPWEDPIPEETDP